jgi:adenylate kinase family enzyme
MSAAPFDPPALDGMPLFQPTTQGRSANVFPASILPGTWTQPNLPIVINLFGGPGIGKTTTAARIFVQLKMLGIETANPEEHAKLAIWKGRPDLLDQQLVILGQSWETLHALADKVEAVVMDSPLLLCSVYAGDRERPHFHATVVDFHRRMPRLNLLLTRAEGRAYSTTGRREDADTARSIDGRIRAALDAHQEPFTELPSGEGVDPEILDREAAAIARLIAQTLAQRNKA